MNKILTIDQFENIRKTLHSPVILTGGCFDILHIGHIVFFEELQKLKGSIIVLLESDATLQKLKGEDRPIHTQVERAKILSLLPVHTIILLKPLTSHKSYYRLVKSIKPDIIAITEGDPLKDIKRDQARDTKATLFEVPKYTKSPTTSKIIEILRKEV